MAGTKNDAHHHDVHDSPHGFLVCVPLGANPRGKCPVGWVVGEGPRLSPSERRGGEFAESRLGTASCHAQAVDHDHDDAAGLPRC